MTQVIRGRSLKKSYSGRLVLDLDEFVLEPGEVLTLTGPNGAGKSTLLRLISLIEFTDKHSGPLELFGLRPSRYGRTSLRRRLSAVWQEPFIFRRSVYDNIALALRWRGLTGDVIDARVKEASGLLGLTDLDRPAWKLSRGWAQRTAIARALAVQPELLLLDEPLSALDTAIRGQLLADLKPLLRAGGRSAIYVTHDFQEASMVGDRRVHLVDGRASGFI